jgi:hypothetical protein
LYSGDARVKADDDLFEEIVKGKYLSSENQAHLDKLSKESKQEPSEERILLLQVALVVFGFVVAFIGAVRIPAG